MNLLFLLSGVLLGFCIAWLFFKLRTQNGLNDNSEEINSLNKKINLLDQENARLEERANIGSSELESTKLELTQEREKLGFANGRIARAEETFKNLNEKLLSQKTEMEDLNKKLSLEFENIANKLLEEKSRKFTEQNKSNLDIILNPLKERIKDFEEKVEKAYKSESEERITLKTEIKSLVDMNKQISQEANNLAKALKGDNKKQGNWGEIILEKVLERSGLVKDQEYRTQVNTTNDEGKKIQPDVIVLLPDNKHIIIDSKVSLTAYETFVNSDHETTREQSIKEHISSLKSHIKGLSEKNYHTASDIVSPDFVLLFIPIESSFSTAIQADNEIFSYAWERNIVLVSPSTLLATLKTISNLWKQEKQTKNALEIADQGGKLYDKFVGFAEDMLKIGEKIAATQTVYDDAMNKLSKGTGNLVKRAENIRKLGAKSTKQISEKLVSDDDIIYLD